MALCEAAHEQVLHLVRAARRQGTRRGEQGGDIPSHEPTHGGEHGEDDGDPEPSEGGEEEQQDDDEQPRRREVHAECDAAPGAARSDLNPRDRSPADLDAHLARLLRDTGLRVPQPGAQVGQR